MKNEFYSNDKESHCLIVITFDLMNIKIILLRTYGT